MSTEKVELQRTDQQSMRAADAERRAELELDDAAELLNTRLVAV
jgi:hypothetical protein